MDAVDAARPKSQLASGGVIHGLSQGGYTGRVSDIPLVPETRPYSYPQATVQVDYIAFLEQAKEQERWRVLRQVLDAVAAIQTGLPGSRSWEDKHISGDKLKERVLKEIMALM